ncbi:MAG: hypothetical protein HWE22_10390 [Flavobacteriales bacterium]|nr:hypothetical protein [Flavobacteriales bacterium]
MSTLNKSYPRLSDVVTLESLPEQLGFIKDGLENLLDGVFVKEFQVEKSPSGDTRSFYVVIVAFKELGIGIPGTDFKLLFNPDPSDPTQTIIPISVTYEQEILKYVSNFSLDSFSAEPFAFFNMLLEILDIEISELLEQIIDLFTENGSIAELVAMLNEVNDLAGTINEIPVPLLNDPEMAIRELTDSIFNSAESAASSFAYLVFKILDQVGEVEDILDNIDQLFAFKTGTSAVERVKELFIPKIQAELDVSLAFQFPRNVLVPIKPDGTVEDDEAILLRLDFDFDSFNFSTEGGIGYPGSPTVSFPGDYPKAQIGQTGFTIGFTNAKVDFSKETNIPEATADGRPNDFIGVFVEYLEIGLPPFIKDDPTSPPGGAIVGRNLLIGTGGISGTVGLETTGAGLCKTFGDKLKACFNSFDMTFQQNAIVGSNINGTLMIPGFEDAAGNPAEININVHIGQDGDFKVTASEDQSITAIKIKDILSIELSSVFVGREDGRWFFGISGAVNFEDLGGAIGNFLPDKLDIKKLIIWDDGEIEIEGGKITLPKAVSLKLGPVELSVTAVGMGSHEQERTNSNTLLPEMRKYKYVTFDGGISVNPGGVDASGNGIALYWTSDVDESAGRDLHFYMRIQSIAIDIVIPGNAKPEDAALLLSGFLAMKDTASGTEYQGGVDFTLPKLKMGGSAAMRLNPKVPAFLIDVGLELSTPIVLGATGLGIYGFRGLVGQRYVATKEAANVDPTEPWWKYYKAKIEPDYKEGIQGSKFEQTDGFSLGAGVSLATATDSGKAFSAKIFFLLSLPEVFLLQGQGQILKERIGLDTTQDPPFFALVAITSNSVETAFGVNYKIPDDGDNPGGIATVDGLIEMGFFWGNSGAWYINIGKDLPESRRIQVRLLDLFNAYFYFMLSSNGISTGAGASFEVEKKFGPLRAELSAYLDVAGKISKRPKQKGASIQLGGSAGLYIFGFGFSIGAAASLAAESAKPFIVAGSVKVCVKVLRKDRCAEFSFTWTFTNDLDLSETPLLKENLRDSAKAINMQTQESFELWAGTSLPADPDNDLIGNIVPMDSFIDIEFLHGVLPSTNVLNNFGGNTMGSSYIDYVPPQRGKSDRVKHEYLLQDVKIMYHNGSAWVDFDIYAANTPMSMAPFVTTPLTVLKSGYWQYQSANLHNKLRIMAQSPLSYTSMGTGDVVVEDLGITTEEIFCPPGTIQMNCTNYEVFEIPDAGVGATLIPQDQLIWHEQFLMRINSGDGDWVTRSAFSLTKAVRIQSGESMEIIFSEPKADITLKLQTVTDGATVSFYRREQDLQPPGTLAAPTFSFVLVSSQTVLSTDSGIVDYSDTNNPIDRIVVDAGTCAQQPTECTEGITAIGQEFINLLQVLASRRQLTKTTLLTQSPYDNLWMNSLMYAGQGQCENPSPTWIPVAQTANSLIINIVDNCGYSCEIEFQLLQPNSTFSFDAIKNFTNPRLDLTVGGDGTGYLIDLNMNDGSMETVYISTCFESFDCSDMCATYVYSVCTLDVESALINATMPTLVEVEEEVQTIINSFNGSIQPIWRPDTNYAIQITTKDKLNREGGGYLTEHNNTAVYGFRTMGPIGHFHKYRNDAGINDMVPDYQALETVGSEDEFKLKNLLYYIDFPKCYPNADGQLINAKPLFFEDPKLLLYYTQNYVYEMFHNWSPFGGLPQLDIEFKVTILDPAIEEGATNSDGVLSWTLSELPLVSEEVTILNNMMTNGMPCSTTTVIDPQYPVANFQLPTLKPLKLYTAVFNLSYKRFPETEFETREILRYGFQTSRYANFTDQVGSWQLEGAAQTEGATREAIFYDGFAIDPADLATAITVVQDTVPTDDALRQEFGHPYNRLLEGALKMQAMEAPISTEFNVIKDTNSGNVIGILVKNPEPFNDPKLPSTELSGCIQMTVNAGGTFEYLYSKDLSSIFITNGSMNLGLSNSDVLEFTFKYKQYNGVDYDIVQTEIISFTYLS